MRMKQIFNVYYNIHINKELIQNILILKIYL